MTEDNTMGTVEEFLRLGECDDSHDIDAQNSVEATAESHVDQQLVRDSAGTVSPSSRTEAASEPMGSPSADKNEGTSHVLAEAG